MRKLIADHMVNSKKVSPHVTSFVEADVTNIVNWRNKVKDEFLDKVIKRVKKIKVGDPLDLKSNMGSMISKGHLQTVDGILKERV